MWINNWHESKLEEPPRKVSINEVWFGQLLRFVLGFELMGVMCKSLVIQYVWELPMAEWLEQASWWHEMYCHNLEAMILNPSWVKRGAWYFCPK